MVNLTVPIERISEQARQVRPSRAVLTIVAAVLFGFGWITARVLGALWLALAWTSTAVKVGWQEGRQGRRSGGRR